MAAATRPNLYTVIDTQFADNGARSITAAKARIVCRAIAESCLVLLSDDYVDVTELNAAIAALVGSAAPGYDTLGELQALIEARYTKTEMQTSGQAQLHYNNLTNVPLVALDAILGDVKINLIGYPMSGLTSGNIFNTTDGRGYGIYDKWAVLGMSYAGTINANWGTGAVKRFLGVQDRAAVDGWQTLSGNVGANTHTLSIDELPAHAHNVQGSNTGGGVLGDPRAAITNGNPQDAAYTMRTGQGPGTNDLYNGDTPASAGTAHNNIPATLVAQYIVRVLA